jgi:hypothetical protein
MNRYLNLDIELLGYQKDGGEESLRARVSASPVGEQRDTEASRVTFPSGLRDRIRKLEHRELSFEELITLGEELASLLLPMSVRKILKRSRDKLGNNEGLRIRIRAHDFALAELPWEYVYAGRVDIPPGRKGEEGFLALDAQLSLVRYEVLGEAPAVIKPLERHDIRAIAVLADVDNPAYAKLDLDREELNMRQALEGIAGINTRFLRPGTGDQLDEALTEDAQIFHFSGHGKMERQMGDEPGTIEGEGQLIFASDSQQAEPIDVSTLALLLRSKGIRLPVLGACEAARRDPETPWSGIASALVHQGIPAVVGMQYTVHDSSALTFSRRFYSKLAAGASIDSAVTEGRLGILRRGGGEERDWGVPVLYMRAEGSVLFPPPIAPLRRNLFLAMTTIVLLSAWFYLHIFPLFMDGSTRLAAQAGLGTGVFAAVMVLYKAIKPLWDKAIGREQSSLLERLFRHRWAKGVLTSSLAGAVALFATTSSLYLTHDGESRSTINLSVKTPDGHQFPELVTSPAEGKVLAGGPLFMFPPPRELILEVTQPAGWSLTSNHNVRPRPWKRLDLHVTRDFKKQELRVLRLAPDNSLFSHLPKTSVSNPNVIYQLQVKIGEQGDTYKRDDFRKGVVVIGGPRKLIETRIAKEEPANRNASIGKCVSGNASAKKMMNDAFRSNEKILVTPIIKPSDIVLIQVINKASGKVRSELSISGDSLLTESVDTKCLKVNKS